MIILGKTKKYKWKVIRGIFLSFFVILFTLISFLGLGARVAGFAGIPAFGQSFFSGEAPKTVSAELEPSVSNIIPSDIPENPYPLRNWNIQNLQIQALSAISIEMGNNTNKVLFIKDQTKKLPIASLTKLMTALVVLEHYNLDQKVTISTTVMTQEGQQGNLKAGEILSVKDLLYITLVESGNRSAYALSEISGTENFVDTMNKTAKKLGLDNTHFADSTGLSPASHSTAQDIATLTKHLSQTYPIFNQIITTREYDLYLPNGQFHHTLINTNKLLGVAPEIIGGKTGWTTEAKGCFVVLSKSPIEGNYIISVVLGSDDRFLEIKNIIEWTRQAYAWQ